ncbi:DUF488 domain-containing protein [Streptomyces sp. NPDC050560]|uniref:DUF488 domain-containing protein n=1 Tax=Streptomyces sp. NPDC050560 TaxID=3365630 RepID=UPI0037BBB3DE
MDDNSGSRGRGARRDIRLRRVYEEAEPDGGARVLVDRVWPRGLSKEAAGLDSWRKDVAPSTELRKWYGHDPGRHEEFERRYRAELAAPEAAEALDELREEAARGPLTLLTSVRDVDLSHAATLRRVLAEG